MGVLKFLRACWTNHRFAQLERNWDRSPRKREIEAECELPPRPLTPEEDLLLRWILEHSLEEAKTFLPQVDGMQAVRSCICGCPTIHLSAVEGAPLGNMQSGRIICDLIGKTAKSELVGLMLFQNGGKLSCLEGYSLDAEIGPPEFGFPVLEGLGEFEVNQPVAEQQ